MHFEAGAEALFQKAHDLSMDLRITVLVQAILIPLHIALFLGHGFGRRKAREHEGDHIDKPANRHDLRIISSTAVRRLCSSTERVDAPACSDGDPHVAESVLTAASSFCHFSSLTQEDFVQDVRPACHVEDESTHALMLAVSPANPKPSIKMVPIGNLQNFPSVTGHLAASGLD